nr:PAN APPLE domain containing protein [Pandoravirus aubagnensis]
MNAPAGTSTTGSAKGVVATPVPAKLVPPSAAKPAVVTTKETTVVVPAAPTIGAGAAAPPRAVVVAGAPATLPPVAPQEAAAPKPKGLWGLPTWAWIAIGAVVLLIVIAIIGEFVVRRRGGGSGATYTLVANSNPVCDIADNKCDVASGTNEVSAEACKARCDKVRGCEGVLYDRSGLLGGANCWVKRFTASPPKTDAWTGADFYYKKTATA